MKCRRSVSVILQGCRAANRSENERGLVRCGVEKLPDPISDCRRQASQSEFFGVGSAACLELQSGLEADIERPSVTQTAAARR
jgi:hypothetical protein